MEENHGFNIKTNPIRFIETPSTINQINYSFCHIIFPSSVSPSWCDLVVNIHRRGKSEWHMMKHFNQCVFLHCVRCSVFLVRKWMQHTFPFLIDLATDEMEINHLLIAIVLTLLPQSADFYDRKSNSTEMLRCQWEIGQILRFKAFRKGNNKSCC